MADFDNTNRGALFRPKERRSDAAPQWRGTVNVNGVDWELSIWEKTSKNGVPFLSCAFKPPYVAPEKGQDAGRGVITSGKNHVDANRAALGPQKPPRNYRDMLDDDLPPF
jgi:hypothetical protein